MSGRKVVVLDGAQAGDEGLAPSLAVLIEELRRDGREVQTFNLREIKLGHCIGCFGCWLETPGICVEADAGREIVQAIILGETVTSLMPVPDTSVVCSEPGRPGRGSEHFDKALQLSFDFYGQRG